MFDKSLWGIILLNLYISILLKLVIYYKLIYHTVGVMVDTYEHLDALGTCFPWCTMSQEKPIKCKKTYPLVNNRVFQL